MEECSSNRDSSVEHLGLALKCSELSDSSRLHKSISLVRWSHEGREADLVLASLDPCKRLLRFKTPKGSSINLDVQLLKLVLVGNKPKDTGKVLKLLGSAEEIDDKQCLSLYFGDWPWKELHVISSSTGLISDWHSGLLAIVNSPSAQTGGSKIDHWLRSLYIEIANQNSGKVHAVTAIGSFASLRLWKAYKVLKKLLDTTPTLKQLFNEDQTLHHVSFSVFQALYYSYMAQQRPDIQEVYNAHCDSDGSSTVCPPVDQGDAKLFSKRKVPGFANLRRRSSAGDRTACKEVAVVPTTDGVKAVRMTATAFLAFLKSSQGMRSATMEEVVEIIQKYDHTENVDYITLAGFAHYLMSQETAPKELPQSRLTHPLTDYFIASSHNTYLTGHQLHGESSVNMYITVLHTGCRCVELDCWDGEDGDPVIYHGHTFTTKIKFRDVIKAIAEHAFAASPYPLVLSLENHCSKSQQIKMASDMKSLFGEMLLTDCIDENPNAPNLPSPEDLKYKILIKTTKCHSQRSMDLGADPAVPTKMNGCISPTASYTHHSVARTTPSPINSPLFGSNSFARSPSSPSSPASPTTPQSDVERRALTSPSLREDCSTVGDKMNAKAGLSPLSSPCPSTPMLDGTSIYTIFEEEGLLNTSRRNSLLDIAETAERDSMKKGSDVLRRQDAVASEECESHVSRSEEVLGNVSTPQSDSLGSSKNALCMSSEEEEAQKSTVLDISLASSTERKGKRNPDNEMEHPVGSTGNSGTIAVAATKPEEPNQLGSGSGYSEKHLNFPPQMKNLAEVAPMVQRRQSPLVTHDLRYSGQHRRGSAPTLTSHERSLSDTFPTSLLSRDESLQPLLCKQISLTSLTRSCVSPSWSSTQSSSSTPRSTGTITDSCLVLCNSESFSEEHCTSQHPNAWSSNESLNGTPDKRSTDPSSAQDQHIEAKSDQKQTKTKLLYRRRRGSLGVLQRPSSPASSSGSELEGSVIIADTVEASFQKKDVAQELSQLVVYTEPVKFNGFKDVAEKKSSEMYSMSESTAKRAIKKTSEEYLNFSTNHLMRVYPAATRINSSNYNPANYWSCGTQMVALNYQTNDVPMQYYMSVFAQTGRNGYVLKPQSLREPHDGVSAAQDSLGTELTITVVSAQHLRVDNHLPTLEMEILGVPADRHKVRAQASQASGCCLLWKNNNNLSCNISVKELAAVHFTVYSDGVQDGYSCMLPVTSLSTGYQHIYFKEGVGGAMQPLPSLLIHASLKENEVAKESKADDCSQASLSVEVPANEVEKQAIDIPDCQEVCVTEDTMVGLGGDMREHCIRDTAKQNTKAHSTAVHRELQQTNRVQHERFESQLPPEKSVMVKPIAPAVAKQFIEDYYHKLNERLAVRVQKNPLQRKKKRTISFNSVDIQRPKKYQQRHSRRASVDVDLLLGKTCG